MALVDILRSSDIRVTPGLELLDSNDVLIEDITTSLDPESSISRKNRATIHGTCDLHIDRALNWESQRFRPYMTLTDQATGEVSQRYNLGIFLAETPAQESGESGETFHVHGYDKLVVLDTPLGSSYRIGPNVNVLDEVENLILAAGETNYTFTPDADPSVTATERVWPIDAKNTRLRVINDLLGLIGYRALYVDRNGQYRSEPYEGPSARPITWTYDDTLANTDVALGAALEIDLFDTANKWVFVRDDPDPGQAIPIEGDGIYTVTNQSDGITSINARGRTIVRIERFDVATQTALERRGDRVVELSKELTASVDLLSVPNPSHWHADVVTLNSPAIGVSNRRFTEISWKLPLNGKNMSHDLRRVT